MDIIILYGPRPRCITWLYQALKMCTSITAGCWESNEAGMGIVFLSQICTSLSKNADCLSHIYFPESLHLLGFSCASSVPLVLFNQQSFLAHAWPVICLSRNVKLRNFGLLLWMMCGSQNSCWRWELKRYFLGAWTWTTRKSDVRRWKSKDLMDFHHINI